MHASIVPLFPEPKCGWGDIQKTANSVQSRDKICQPVLTVLCGPPAGKCSFDYFCQMVGCSHVSVCERPRLCKVEAYNYCVGPSSILSMLKKQADFATLDKLRRRRAALKVAISREEVLFFVK